jgi:hypothetical protein
MDLCGSAIAVEDGCLAAMDGIISCRQEIIEYIIWL